MRRILLLLTLLLIGATADASAQARAPVAIVLDSSGKAPRIMLNNVAENQQWLDVIASGLTLRINFTLQVWKRGGLFGSSRFGKAIQWTFAIDYRRTFREYQSKLSYPGRYVDPVTDSTLAGLARKVFENPLAPVDPRIPPSAPGEYYYSVQVDWSTITSEEYDRLSRFQGNSPGLWATLIQALNAASSPGGKLPVAQTTPFKIP